MDRANPLKSKTKAYQKENVHLFYETT